MNKSMNKEILKKKKKKVFQAWVDFIQKQKCEKQKLKKLVQTYWKIKVSKAITSFKSNTQKFKLVEERQKVEGAFIMIDELKDKMRSLDKALERMYKEKSSREDFELLKMSLDQSRAKTIFNDMKELFDVTMIEMKNTME